MLESSPKCDGFWRSWDEIVKEKLENGRVVIRGHSGPENGSMRRALRFVIWSVFLVCLENTLFPLP